MEANLEKTKKIKRLISLVESSDLASIKGIVSGVVRLINDPRSNARDFKEIIQMDPPMAAKVLRVANSSYYSSPRPISEIDQAIIWIGFDALKEIALTQKISEVFEGDTEVNGYSRELLWRHSLAVAQIVKLIYRREFGQKGNDAYAAGLMHDIGIIVEDQLVHEDFKRVLQGIEKERGHLVAAEDAVFGFNHSDIGRALTREWNFPDELSGPIGFHHDPASATPLFEKLTQTLYVADRLAMENGFGCGSRPPVGIIQFEKCADDLRLTPYALSSIVRLVQDNLSRIEDQGVFES